MISDLLFQQGLPLTLKGEGYRRFLFYEDNAYSVSFSSFFFRSLQFFDNGKGIHLAGSAAKGRAKYHRIRGIGRATRLGTRKGFRLRYYPLNPRRISHMKTLSHFFYFRLFILIA